VYSTTSFYNGEQDLGAEEYKEKDSIKEADDNFYHCTVHSDICRVHSPTNALLLI
jgi:hypothetical protein